MRWSSIRNANIEPELRTALEQYGVPVMQQLLAVSGAFRFKGQMVWVDEAREPILAWLTERYDRDERKETWLITMKRLLRFWWQPNSVCP
jgi:hypothetical protein